MDSFSPTTKTQAAMTAALQAASSAGNPDIRPAHLLVALLDQTDGIAAPLLKAVGVDPVIVRNAAQAIVDRLPKATGATQSPQLGREALAALTGAQHLATELDDEYVSTEHLLFAAGHGHGALVATLLEPRKEFEHALHVLVHPAGADGNGAHQQILFHRHIRKDAPSFRRLGNAAGGDKMR